MRGFKVLGYLNAKNYTVILTLLAVLTVLAVFLVATWPDSQGDATAREELRRSLQEGIGQLEAVNQELQDLQP